MPWTMILTLLICQLFVDPAIVGAAGVRRDAAASPPMTFNSLTSRANSTDGTSFSTTATYTPTANAIVLAAVVNSKATTPDLPTFSGNGLTWNRIATTNFNTTASPTLRLTLFYAFGASPTTTVGTADFAGATQTGANIMIVEFPNADTTAPFVQTNAFASDNTGLNQTNFLAAINASGSNAVYVTFGNNKLPFTGSTKVPWVEDFDVGYNTPATGGYVTHILATTDNICWVTNNSTTAWGTIGVEIKQKP